MTRLIILAMLAVTLSAAPAQARLIKEMQVTRTGKIAVATEGSATVYRLMLENNKMIVVGDREFFPPATRAALDQAAERKLTVEIAGGLLIFNDQPPVFTLPLSKLDVRGLDMRAQSPPAAADPAASLAEPHASGDPEPFKSAKLKFNSSVTLGQALDNYAFFTSRSWRVLEPNKAEFRGEVDLSSITELDSRYVSRLNSKDLHDTFKSLTFVATINLKRGSSAECPDPSIEAVFQDGVRDRLVWKDPPTYYWERIYQNRKIKFDYFLSKAILNPKFGKGAGQPVQ
ncbi:hypothetical protein [Fundidesulfovibrio terrae]|uniref:hypothetical protein n=1 Tax=Fundidesulfovibrio terrae TaxID=2922866 RepID=UPI001FAEFB04|nr:hypothetical protein [Fundidesulfovibrio terrae]